MFTVVEYEYRITDFIAKIFKSYFLPHLNCVRIYVRTSVSVILLIGKCDGIELWDFKGFHNTFLSNFLLLKFRWL